MIPQCRAIQNHWSAARTLRTLDFVSQHTLPRPVQNHHCTSNPLFFPVYLTPVLHCRPLRPPAPTWRAAPHPHAGADTSSLGPALPRFAWEESLLPSHTNTLDFGGADILKKAPQKSGGLCEHQAPSEPRTWTISWVMSIPGMDTFLQQGLSKTTGAIIRKCSFHLTFLFVCIHFSYKAFSPAIPTTLFSSQFCWSIIPGQSCQGRCSLQLQN